MGAKQAPRSRPTMSAGLRAIEGQERGPAAGPRLVSGTAGRAIPSVDPLPHALDAIRHGLLIIGSDDGVAVCTVPARRLLESRAPGLREGASVRQGLRIARGLGPAARRAAFAHLRRARDQGAVGTFEVTIDAHRIAFEINPVSGGGWAVTIEDV